MPQPAVREAVPDDDMCLFASTQQHDWVNTTDGEYTYRTCALCRRQDVLLDGDTWTVNRWLATDETLDLSNIGSSDPEPENPDTSTTEETAP